MTQQEGELLKNRITVLEEENQRLHQQVDYLRKHLFGQKSEKISVIFNAQMNLFDEAEQESKKSAPEPETQAVKEHRRKKYVGQREELLKNLPHEQRLFTLPEEERICKKCAGSLVSMGKEVVRTEVQFIPAQVKVIDYVRETFECRQCRKENHISIQKPMMPNPVLAHSMASATSVAHVMVQKYGYAMPLYRQEKEWKDLGIRLSRATLGNWIITAARNWLKPLMDKMHCELLKERYIHADETTVQVHQEENRKNATKSYMWLYASGKHKQTHNIRMFEYRPGRKGEYPKKFLKKFQGYLHTDAYVGYEKVENITRCLCWSHARRQFADALPEKLAEKSQTLCQEGIEQINKLFAIEKELKELGQEERKKQRLKREKPVLEAFWSWVEINKGGVLPKSKLYQAMAYAQNHKKELENYLEDGNCNISNNLAENSIRPFTIGRKNWLFSGSPKGAEASAAVYSIIETCKANGVDAYKYLCFIFENLPNVAFMRQPEILDQYMPWSSSIQANYKLD